MKNGFVKLSVGEYDALMIGNYTKSRQLAKQELKITELQEENAKLQEELNEKSKELKECRAFVKTTEEAEK